MEIISMKVRDIIPYEKNPRNIPKEAVEKVAASIKEFGFRQPIVVDKDNVIIVGHTRLMAAKKLKMKEVPVVVAADLTEEQVKAYRLADNRTNEFSEWDADQLFDELQSLLDLDYDMEPFGFSTRFLDDLEGDEEGGDTLKPVEEDDFDTTPPEEPYVKLGEVYRLGNHIVMCGDSTSIDDIAKLLGGGICRHDID